MASPQTHGLISLAVFGVFVLLIALGLAGKITFWEYVSAVLWGIMIDFDKCVSKEYLKDLIYRVLKRGGGPASEKVKPFISWLHVLPGFLLVWIWGLGLHFFIGPSFRFWFPFVFWLAHVGFDYFQKNAPNNPHYSILYPIHKKAFMFKIGYPAKPPWEFILDSAIFMVACFVLLGLLILK